MADVTDILVANLIDAFDQVNGYVAVGLTAAISALVLELRSPRTTSAGRSPGDATEVDTPWGRMGREAAQLLLLGVCFVVGIMASHAAENATTIALRLGNGGEALLGAVCTRASVATGPVGVRLLAAALPILCGVPVIIRAGLRVHGDARWGLMTMAVILAMPYVFLGRFLYSLCKG